MIVCICKGISHRQIEKALEKGNLTLKHIASSCGAGTGAGCGGCHQSLRDIIARYRHNSLATAEQDSAHGTEIMAKALP